MGQGYVESDMGAGPQRFPLMPRDLSGLVRQLLDSKQTQAMPQLSQQQTSSYPYLMGQSIQSPLNGLQRHVGMIKKRQDTESESNESETFEKRSESGDDDNNDDQNSNDESSTDESADFDRRKYEKISSSSLSSQDEDRLDYDELNESMRKKSWSKKRDTTVLNSSGENLDSRDEKSSPDILDDDISRRSERREVDSSEDSEDNNESV